MDPAVWVSTQGPVPAVSPADLKKVRELYAEIKERHSGRNFAVGTEIISKVCSPGADVPAVCYRLSQLEMLRMIGGPFCRYVHDGDLEERVFEVAATFPMEKMGAGVIHHKPPFDVEEFLRQIEAK